MMLPGRLGLETARIPYKDRHGLLWLSRGKIVVEDGTLRFLTAGSPEFEAGDYGVPFQTISLLLMGPGTTISHDALRLLARHGTGLCAIGDGGVRFYTALPLGASTSARARRQAKLWYNRASRLAVARKMYAWRLREVLPSREISVLRGIEGVRMKEVYRLQAQKYGIRWHGRRYDRSNPEAADLPNQAINHAATAIEAAAMIAVAATGTIPQLGFIHEDAAIAFPLDIADLFRDEITIPVAFQAVRRVRKREDLSLEREVRRLAGEAFYKRKAIPRMIDHIKELFDADDDGSDA